MALSSTNNSIQQGYGAQGSPIFNTFPSPVIARRDPTTADINFKVGRSWVNTVLDTAWMLGSKAAGSATWIALGSGTSGGVVTITGTTGGALSPTAGNITITGTANQGSFAGAGSTLTWSLSSTLVAPGSVTATTTLTATLGNITATNGNIVLGNAGNKQVYTSVASTTTAGANSAGTVALVAGTATVNTTAVTANSQIRLTCQGLGTVTAPSALCVSAKSTGVSFTILASQNTDTSTIFWEIVN